MAIRLRYDFRQQADDTLDIYLYSDIRPAYTDLFTGERHDEGSAEGFRAQLDAHPGVRKIRLYINSYGGDVKEGYGIYAQLKRHPSHKAAYVDGIAASIASVICMASDRVIMYRNSVMIIHNMSVDVSGNAAALRKAADDLDKMMEGNREVYLAKAGGKLDEGRLLEMLDAETTLTAQDALNCGLCDEIVDAEAPQPLTEGAQRAMERIYQTLHRDPTQPAQRPAERALKFLGLKKEE